MHNLFLKIMKNTKLIIALALALGLAACGNQPKSNENPLNGNAQETPTATVTETPFDWGALKIGSEIPDKIEGCTIEPVTYMAEGEEQIKYAVKKEGELLVELEPGYDMELMKYTNTMDVINVYSDQYQTKGNFHVGSKINDVLAAYPEVFTLLAMDGNIYVDVDGTQFMVLPEDFEGKLPEIKSSEGAIIAKPTFKPDALVKMIRIYK